MTRPPRYRAWYLDGLLAAGQVPNGHDARPLPYGTRIVRVADDGTETIVTLTPPVDRGDDDAPPWDDLPAGPDNPERPDAADADLVAAVEAEAAALSPAYRTPRDGTSGTATDPDFGYIAQRRRQRVERLLAALDDGHEPDVTETAALVRATRAYIDVARCLEGPTPTRRTR